MPIKKNKRKKSWGQLDGIDDDFAPVSSSPEEQQQLPPKLLKFGALNNIS